ncbi:MAG: sodium transporter, partial [Calditrichota bacterium]
MTVIDWSILVTYMLGMIGLSVYLGRGQSSTDDYYVGGRSLPWWAIGISTMATQSSAISFISKPAFVALKEGGGMTWLQFELALPLAMIVIIAVLVPFFRKLELVSVYEYLELRFDKSIRYLISGVFLFSRGLAAGAVIYATAIVLSVCLEIELWITILIIGTVTVIYDTIGGMTAVIWSDVIQLILLLGGIALCMGIAIA